jgi:Fe2+ transport system protein FeoA
MVKDASLSAQQALGRRLTEAPLNTPLRIVGILGGEGVRRRLLALGFHKDDLIQLESQAILSGPLLVRNLTSDIRVALGRGVAQKVLVEGGDEQA